jgi:YHS domain-containing protein
MINKKWRKSMFRKMTIMAMVISFFGVGGILPSMTYAVNTIQLIAHEDGKHEATDKPSTSDQMKKKEAVENELCPVSGEKIDEKTKVTYEYKGHIYSFCCQGCVDEFKKDPEKYIDKIIQAK